MGRHLGSLFFTLARGLRLRGPAALVAAGVVFGLAVMLFMSWITLPITAAVVGGGKPVEEMPTMVGWGTFSIEHTLFGLVLGVWAAARSRVAVEVPAELPEQRRAA